MRLKTFTPLFTLLAGFLLFANANLATAQKSEPQKITLQNSGLDIILEWASGDKLMLCFEHGTNIYHEDAPIIPESISADGKSAQFNITVPAEIPAGATFNLYGVYQRTDSKTTNGGIFDLGTKKYHLEEYEDDNVTLDKTGTYGDGIINPMLHFSKTNISNTLPLAIGDITLNHAGWIMALHFTNNSGTAITLPSSIYFDSFDSERKWAYGEKNKIARFDFATQTISSEKEYSVAFNISKYDYLPLFGQILKHGETITFYRWIISELNVPELKGTMNNQASTPTPTTLPAKTVANGKVYHIYTELDYNSYLKFSNVPQWQEGTLGGLNVSVPTPEAYPLWVGGVQVHELNASNITGEGITGSVSYNDDDKTLTLDGAKITSSKKTINFNGINLIIDLKNENKVIYTGSNDIAIGADAVGNNLTLQGKGKLDVSSASSLPAISASKLLFNGGNVKVLNTNSFALGATVGGTIAGIELNNCKIETPVNGTIGKHPTKTNIWTILTSDNQPAQTVEIVRTGTGLSTLAAEGIYVWGEKGVISIETSGSASGRTAQIYNVSGILVRTLPLQGTEGQVAVPAGIYIVKIGNAIEKVVVR